MSKSVNKELLCTLVQQVSPQAQLPVCRGEEGETDNQILPLPQSMGLGVGTAANREVEAEGFLKGRVICCIINYF